MKKPLLSLVLILLVCILIAGCWNKADNEKGSDAAAQGTAPVSVKERFAKFEANNLKQPYAGIFSEAEKIDDLFRLHSTGVSTGPIIDAADAFLQTLPAQQLQKIKFDIQDQEWRKWSNVDNGIYERQGISLKEMNPTQKETAFGLMQASLSAKGLQLSKDIMKTDQTLRALNNGSSVYDEELYFFTIMGTPSAAEPWGWQLDGHHLVINFFVLGEQVVMSPVFMGAEPVFTTSGKYTGNTLFQDEQNLGLALMQSLSAVQQSRATLSREKKGNNNQAEANRDNLTLNYEGLPVGEFTDHQREDLLHLIAQYINNIREGHQQVKMEEIMEHIDHTWFAWVGDSSKDAVFYYRIHNPVVLIEFDHQGAVGVPGTDRRNTNPKSHSYGGSNT